MDSPFSRVHFRKPKPVISRFGSAVGSQCRRGSDDGSIYGSYVGGGQSGNVEDAVNPAVLATKLSPVACTNVGDATNSAHDATNKVSADDESVDSHYEES